MRFIPALFRTSLRGAACGVWRPITIGALWLAASACSRVTSSTGTTSGMSASVSAAPAMPAGVTSAMIARGEQLFRTGSCNRCHGAAGVGGERAPSLVAGPWLQHRGTYEQIVATVITGVPVSSIKDPAHKLAMNPRGGPMQLTDEAAREVGAYVWSISRGKR